MYSSPFGLQHSEIGKLPVARADLLLKQSKTMEVRVDGQLGPGVTPKDVILHII
ncbi:homoaconitase/3-isopropylmalate dehydratase large subunit, partial [Croceicoccus naphthovorans]|nr:homoaconitase/3-isopropylmalate dehydratase large subunit [Croceicoccus naphthovorans]